MDPSAFLNQMILSVLLGGVYAIFAIGLSLSVGVLRLVNLAYGDVIVLFAYLIFSLTAGLGLLLLPSLLITLVLAFGLGAALQSVLFSRVTQALLPRLLVTFGLSVIIQNALLLAYGADPRKIDIGGLETAALRVTETITVGILPLLMFGVALAMVAGLEILLYRTRLGADIRAVAENPETADLVGLPTRRILAVSMGLVGLTAAVAAFFMGVWSTFDPSFGSLYLLTAFEVVVLGGLGSLWGMLASGIIIAVAQSLGGQIDAAWQALAGHLVFMAIFSLRPNGLFPKR